ncbi:MAG: hypothetical protein RLZZ48_897 [Actinomycetota bacterium]
MRSELLRDPLLNRGIVIDNHDLFTDSLENLCVSLPNRPSADKET